MAVYMCEDKGQYYIWPPVSWAGEDTWEPMMDDIQFEKGTYLTRINTLLDKIQNVGDD